MDKLYLGIELGSTRIKAVLIDGRCAPIASGAFGWENQWEKYRDELIQESGGFCSYAVEENSKTGDLVIIRKYIGGAMTSQGYQMYSTLDEGVIRYWSIYDRSETDDGLDVFKLKRNGKELYEMMIIFCDITGQWYSIQLNADDKERFEKEADGIIKSLKTPEVYTEE